MTNNATSKLAMLRQIGTLTGHVLRERVRPRYPTDLSEVPASPDHITPEYLTAALCAGAVLAHAECVF